MTEATENCDRGALLYRKYLCGDKESFNLLMSEYREAVIYYAFGILHNTSDAEDAAMDAFADLIIHKHRYSFRCSMKTYLFSVVRHKAIDRLRRVKHTYSGDFEEATADRADIEALEDKVIAGEEAKTVREALTKIHPDYAEVLRLIYYYGMSGDEISTVTGKNKKQIANITYRAKEALRKILAEGGGIR